MVQASTCRGYHGDPCHGVRKDVIYATHCCGRYLKRVSMHGAGFSTAYSYTVGDTMGKSCEESDKQRPPVCITPVTGENSSNFQGVYVFGSWTRSSGRGTVECRKYEQVSLSGIHTVYSLAVGSGLRASHPNRYGVRIRSGSPNAIVSKKKSLFIH